MNARFVLVDKEVWLLQVEDENLFPRWGFALVDDDGQTWEGGFGIAKEWTVVPDDQVPAEVQARFEHLLKEL